MPNYSKFKQRRKFHPSNHRLSVTSQKPLEMLYLNLILSKKLPFIFQITGCAILLHKQPAVPSRQRKCATCIFSYLYKTRQERTKRIGVGLFNNKRNRQNEIMKIKVKDKFTDTMLQQQQYVSMCRHEHFNKVIYDICCKSSSTIIFTFFWIVFSASNPRCKPCIV